MREFFHVFHQDGSISTVMQLQFQPSEAALQRAEEVRQHVRARVAAFQAEQQRNDKIYSLERRIHFRTGGERIVDTFLGILGLQSGRANALKELREISAPQESPAVISEQLSRPTQLPSREP